MSSKSLWISVARKELEDDRKQDGENVSFILSSNVFLRHMKTNRLDWGPLQGIMGLLKSFVVLRNEHGGYGQRSCSTDFTCFL